MPHPVQRTSCDRCHDMKLRCTRTASGACVRCTKAKATCVWTPSIRAQKAQKYASSEATSSSVNDTSGPGAAVIGGSGVGGDSIPSFDSMNICMDKSTFPLPAMPQDANTLIGIPHSHELEFDSGPDFSGSATSWSGTNFVGSASWSSPNFPGSSDSSAPPQFLQPNQAIEGWQDRFNQEWAMLSAEEQMHDGDGSQRADRPSPGNKTVASRGLPLDAIRQINDLNVDLFSLASVVPQPPTSINQPLSWKYKDVAIDRTFQLSQTFIEAIDKLYPRKEHSGSAANSPAAGSDVSGSVIEGHPPLDQASFLLILSCYQRLIETYNDIFGNMQACMDRSSVTAREDYVQMPDVKVGAFALPDSSALQITLILQLARHLLRRMGSIIRDLNQKGAMAGDGSNELMALTFQAVTVREADLIERINRLRNTLVSLDIL